MAAPTLPDNKEEDALRNPSQKHYEENMGAGYISHGQDQLEAFANDPANHSQNDTAKSLSEAESQAGGARKVDDVRDEESAPGGWRVNRNGNNSGNYNRPKLKKAVNFAKKRGGIIGLIALFGVGGGLIASLFGPASMIINLMENASITNDSSSTVLEKRVMKVLGFMTKDVDPVCANRTNNLKCKMGRISNSALDKLVAKGVTPVFDNDTDNNSRKKTGYPTKNPRAYIFKIDGQSIEVPNNELVQRLRESPKLAAKVLGTGGAINLRVSNWGGRYITQQFYNKFGLKKDGGIADGKNGKLTVQERYKAAMEKLRSRIPGAEKLATVENTLREKVRGHMGKAQKGGVAYVSLVAGCIGVKAPGYVASAVAAYQLSQVMPFAMDLVLSPGSKAKISGLDTEHSINGDDMDTVGTILNEKSPREGDGKLTSAMDSPYLQAAIGVNTNKPPVSKDYAPGYSILTNPAIQVSQDIAAASEPACNVILSPAAMWSAFAVDSAITVVASATVIGGLAKVLLGFAVGAVAGAAAEETVAAAGKVALAEFANNDKIPTAEGQALGDVTGIALSSFFSAGAAARHLPVLKQSEVVAFEQATKENEDFKKEMDIASLSPFDVSSRYTFLGSILNSTKVAMMTGGIYNGSFSSIVSSLAHLPSSLLSTKVGAAEYTDNLCGYAEDFGQEAGPNTPCITQAGTPGYGMTDEQLNIETNQALTIIENSQWLDETKTLNDTTNIADMVKSTYIKADTPMSDFITSCQDLSTGDYAFNAAGCTVSSANDLGTQAGYEDASIVPATTAGLMAMSPALVDFQAFQMINDLDVGGSDQTAGGTALVGRPDGAVDAKNGWTFAPGVDYSQYPCDPRTPTFSERHVIIPNQYNSPASGAIIRLCTVPVPFSSGETNNGANLISSVISTNFMNMLEKARGEGKMIRLNDGFRIEFNSGYQSQHTTGLSLDLGVDGESTICFTLGGWGNAARAENACRDKGGAQYAAYQWLQQNAATYGFYNLEYEPWHWSTSGL